MFTFISDSFKIIGCVIASVFYLVIEWLHVAMNTVASRDSGLNCPGVDTKFYQ